MAEEFVVARSARGRPLAAHEMRRDGNAACGREVTGWDMRVLPGHIVRAWMPHMICGTCKRTRGDR